MGTATPGPEPIHYSRSSCATVCVVVGGKRGRPRSGATRHRACRDAQRGSSRRAPASARCHEGAASARASRSVRRCFGLGRPGIANIIDIDPRLEYVLELAIVRAMTDGWTLLSTLLLASGHLMHSCLSNLIAQRHRRIEDHRRSRRFHVTMCLECFGASSSIRLVAAR